MTDGDESHAQRPCRSAGSLRLSASSTISSATDAANHSVFAVSSGTRAERRGQHSERGQVFELIVLIVGAIERFSRCGARAPARQ